MVLGISKIGFRLRDQHAFIWQSLRILNVFNTLILKQVFWKTKTFLKNLEYHFLVQSGTNESTTFPYKASLSKANAKTNWMGIMKWTYDKTWTFALTAYFFLNKASYK